MLFSSPLTEMLLNWIHADIHEGMSGLYNNYDYYFCGEFFSHFL